MHLRRSWVILLVLIFMLTGFIASCGGGNDQSGEQENEASEGQGASSERQGGTGQKEGGAPGTKIALGKVQNVKAENKRFSVVPSVEEQGEKPIAFKVTPNAKITLDGKEVDLADVKKGQQAQVKYIVREEMGVPNRVRGIELFSNDGGSGGGGGGGATG